MTKILVVVAHPDDEILGCGGTVLRRIAEGDEVYSLILGEGMTARYDKKEMAGNDEITRLHVASARVSKAVGFKKSWIMDFPDNRFDSVPLLDIIKAVERVKREVMPDVIYTHFEKDLNIDHRITFQAVLTACRPLADETVKEILSFEIPSSTEWVSPCSGENCFRPGIFVDITETIEKKVKTMEMYESEVKDYPHPRSPESLRIISKKWGIVCGLKNAEAFMLVRKII